MVSTCYLSGGEGRRVRRRHAGAGATALALVKSLTPGACALCAQTFALLVPRCFVRRRLAGEFPPRLVLIGGHDSHIGASARLPERFGSGLRLSMYVGCVSRRSRIATFGSAGMLVIAGALCAVLISGLVGQLLTLVLVSIGLGGAVLLIFLEVGLSEDRERAQEAERQAKAARPRPTHPVRQRASHFPRRRG
jgi:hypothetical protein